MGVRGTTFYAAAPAGEKGADLCACSGTIAVNGREVTGKNHDLQRSVAAGGKLSPKNLIGTHNEEQIAILKKLVGE